MKSFAFILIASLLLWAGNTRACICDTYYVDIKDINVLTPYVFIGHVKITGLEELAPDPFHNYRYARWTFTILERFKGSDSIRSVVEPMYRSSCGMGIQVGDEWLFFADKSNGRPIVGFCGRSRLYRHANGERFWNFSLSTNILNRLKELYHHPITALPDGTHLLRYPNGAKEEEFTTKDGKRQGKGMVWYINGVGWLDQNYVNDTLHGVSHTYYKTGQLDTERYYDMGQPFGVARTYIDSSSKRLLFAGMPQKDTVRAYTSLRDLLRRETVYGLSGDIITTREYESPSILRKETVYTADSFSTTVYYHSNGQVSGVYYEKAYRPYGVAKEFDENGKLTKIWKYDSSGKQIFFRQERK